MDKQDKPRIAEVLGVEVGERFRIVGGDFDTVEFYIQEDGEPSTYVHAALPYAINHPESIIRTPRLTEPEIAIMRAVGARWVSRDPRSESQVELYSEKPEYRADGEFVPQSGKKCVAIIYDAERFPSVKPGECIGLDKTE